MGMLPYDQRVNQAHQGWTPGDNNNIKTSGDELPEVTLVIPSGVAPAGDVAQRPACQ